MRDACEVIRGTVVEYNPATQMMTVKARYPDWKMFARRQYRDCEIRLIDGRPLSNRQRKSVYALLQEISRYTGQSPEATKQIMKRKFLDEELCEPDMETFSLRDAPMSMVCMFQRYLIRFMLEFEIPSRVPLLNFADDAADYICACLENRKCCICGRPAELHHMDAVGMGRDRREIIHEGMKVLPLCREHHEECHACGKQSFIEKYHLPDGIRMTGDLCRLYGMN